MTAKTYSPKDLRALASKEYAKTAKTANGAPLLPGPGKVAIAKATGLPKSRLASAVDPVYFEANGRANPIALPKTRTERTLSVAVRKRRDAGGTLGRWESVAAALSESLGRPVSESAVRSLYAKSGGDLEASYTGRGTRAAAPKTRADESVEIVAK